jgi:ketosteroid isomerase-like protein
MKRSNLEYLIGWLDALRRDDRETLKSHLAPDVVWQGLRDEWTCHGADEVADTFTGERDARREVEAIEIIGGERHAVLHASGGGVTAIDDIPLPDGIYNVFAIEDGRISNIADYANRADALSAADLA